MANPIWKDYFVNLGSDDSISYRILLLDTLEVLYTGKSFLRPGEEDNNIRINDICADFFRNTLPSIGQTEFSALSFPISFRVQKQVNNNWSNVATVAFDNNWSYDYGHNPSTMGISFPINGRIDPRMPLVVSAYNASQIVATLHFRDGSSFQVFVPVARSDDFNNDFNVDFSRETRGSASGTAVFLPSDWTNLDRIVVGRNTFKVVDTCARYALYYVNSYGGWDSLLIEGNTTETDNATRYDRAVDYDNRNISNRGDENYLNDIVKSYQLVTGWLTDEQSHRMFNLVYSTCVYLYDLTYGQMIPVIVTDASLGYKTYKNQGNRMVNYTINVQVAQSRIRR